MTSKPSPLTDILARARAAARPAAEPVRELPGATPAARFAAILGEIDETMLPRALTFRLGGHSRLVVEARERRAVRIAAIEPEDEGVAGLRAVLERSDKTPAEECAALAGIVAAFSAAEGPLTVVSEPSGLPPSVVDKGFSAEELARSGAAPAPEPEAPTAAEGDAQDGGPATASAPEALLHACAAVQGAAVLADSAGRTLASQGAPNALPLESLARGPALPGTGAGGFLDAAIPGPRLVCLGREGGEALCHSASEAQVALAEVAPADLGRLISEWREALPRDEG